MALNYRPKRALASARWGPVRAIADSLIAIIEKKSLRTIGGEKNDFGPLTTALDNLQARANAVLGHFYSQGCRRPLRQCGNRPE
jgi:hypothetical protein